MASTVRLGAKPLLRGLLTSPDTSAELPAQDTSDSCGSSLALRVRAGRSRRVVPPVCPPRCSRHGWQRGASAMAEFGTLASEARGEAMLARSNRPDTSRENLEFGALRCALTQGHLERLRESGKMCAGRFTPRRRPRSLAGRLGVACETEALLKAVRAVVDGLQVDVVAELRGVENDIERGRAECRSVSRRRGPRRPGWWRTCPPPPTRTRRS